jgi:type II secretory pathway component GspD/PulD (secretin)
MATRWTSPFVTPLAAAFVATLPLSMAMAAGTTQPEQPQSGQTARSAASVLAHAEKLIKDGRGVAGRSLLLSSLQDESIAFGEEDRDQALTLLAQATQQIRDTDPLDLSLQRAHVALAEGDLRTAERHARAIGSNPSAADWQHDQAKRVLAQVEQRRLELVEIIPQTLAQAERDFLRGRYAQAVAGFAMVDRSGIALTEAQQTRLQKYQMQLVALGDQQPDLFGTTGEMGVMQPGVVRRRDQQPGGEQPAEPEQPQPPAEPTEPQAQPPAEPQLEPQAQPQTQPPAGQGEDQLLGQAMQFQAQSELAQADRAFEAGRYNEAAQRYQRLGTEFRQFLSPQQVQHVQSRAAEARGRLGTDRAMQPETVMQERAIAKQQALARFDHELNEARRALETGNISRARDMAASARLTLNSSRELMAEGEFEAMAGRVSSTLAQIEREEQVRSERAMAERELETQRRTAQELQVQRQERDRRIMELIDRARAFQAEQRYQEALQAVEQLLFLEPNHATGLLLREVYQDLLIYRQFNEIRERRHINFAHQSLDNQTAAMAPRYMLEYPLDWPTISVRRGEPVHFAETPENRRILADLDTRRIPTVQFADNALADVLQFIQTITQVNMDVDWQSLDRAGIQRETPVTLNLNNVTARTLLDRVVEQASGPDAFAGNRADWAVQDGMVIVASEERIRRNTALVIYDVRDLLIEVPDYTDVPRIDLNQALQGAGGGGGGGGGGGQSPFGGGGQDNQEQQRRDREERIDDLIDIITENVDYEGWVDNGGTTGRIQKLVNNGNLIITNTPRNHRAISGLLGQLREVRAMQINVETRFLLVNQDWFEQIGFQLDVYFNAENNQVRALRQSNPNFQVPDMFNQGRLQRRAGVPGVPGTTIPVPPPERWSPIGVTQNTLGLASGIAPTTDWSAGILGAAPALGIAGQFLDDIQVDFLIQATQADRRSVQLTAPRLTFTNGQTANIYVATQIAFVSDLEPVVGDSAVGFDPTIAVATEGVTLLVEGTVSADRRYVTMNVDAGVARIDGFASQSVSAVAGGQLVTSASVSSFIQLPQVTVTRVRTTVTVPDQGTILMGGQRLTTEFEVETGVPVLSKLPILNRFFTNRIESKEEQTLLILIKPTILIQNEEEEGQFPGLLDSLRTGWGR